MNKVAARSATSRLSQTWKASALKTHSPRIAAAI